MTAKTVKVPHVKTYEAQWDKRPQPAQINWYKGSQPTQRETLARIYEIGKQDETKRVDLMRMYEDEVRNPNSPIYNPYTSATTSNATKTNVANTLKAQDEWARLSDELSYWATRADRNYSDDEIISRINWDNYKTLQKMDEGRETGMPLELLEGVGYSKDAMYGVLWAARNPGASTGNAMYDAVQGALGRGNQYKTNDVSAYRDATGGKYSPYKAGATALDDLAYKYGMTGDFSRAWLEGEGRALLNGDAQSREDYTRIYNTVTATEAVEKEADAFYNQYAKPLIESGMDPAKIFYDGVFEDLEYKNLDKFVKGGKSGDLYGTAYAVGFDYDELQAEANEYYSKTKGVMTNSEYEQQLADNTGGMFIPDEGREKSNETQQLNTDILLPDYAPVSTDNERKAFRITGSAGYNDVVGTTANYVQNGSGGEEQYKASAIKEANAYANEHLFSAWDDLYQAEEAFSEAGEMSEEVSAVLKENFPEFAKNGTYPTEQEVLDAFRNGKIKMPEDLLPEDQTAYVESVVGAVAGRGQAAEAQDIIDDVMDDLAEAYGKDTEQYNAAVATYKAAYEYTKSPKNVWTAFDNYQYASQQESVTPEMLDGYLSNQRGANANEILRVKAMIENAEQLGIPEKYIANMQKRLDDLYTQNELLNAHNLSKNEDYTAKVGEFDATYEAYKPKLFNFGANKLTESELIRYSIIDPESATKLVDNRNMGDILLLAQNMTDEERSNYKYIFMTEGEEKANEYFNALSQNLYVRSAEERSERVQGFAEDHPLAATSGSFLMVPMEAVSAASTIITKLSGEEVNPYSPTFIPTQVKRDLRTGSKEAFHQLVGEDKKALNWAFDTVYDAITSAADSGINALIGGKYGYVLMGLSGFEAGVMDASMRGANDWQAIGYGLASAAIEGITEKAQIDQIFDSFASGSKAGKAALLKILSKGFFSEAGEEILSAIGTTISDELIMGAMSNREAAIEKYMAEASLTREEAEAQANRDILKDILYSGLVGGLSGVASSGASYGAGKIFGQENSASANAEAAPAEATKATTATAPESGEKDRAMSALNTSLQQGTSESQRAATVAGVFQSYGLSAIEANAAAKNITDPEDVRILKKMLGKADDPAKLIRAFAMARVADNSASAVVLGTKINSKNIYSKAGELMTAYDSDVANSRVSSVYDANVAFSAESDMVAEQVKATGALDHTAVDNAKEAYKTAVEKLDAVHAEEAAAIRVVANAGIKFNQNPADPQAKAELMTAIEQQADVQRKAAEAENNANTALKKLEKEKQALNAKAEEFMGIAREQVKPEVQKIVEENNAAKAEQAAAAELQRETDNALAMEADDFVNRFYKSAPEDVKAKVRERYMKYQGKTQPVSTSMTRVANQFKKKFGLEIEFVDSHGLFKGAYVGKGKIVLDQNATQGDLIRTTLSHEVVHAVRKSNEWGLFSSSVLEVAYDGDTAKQKKDFEKLKEKYSSEAGQSKDDVIMEELVAKRFAEMIDKDPKSFERLAVEKPTVAQRILYSIKEFINKLRGVNDPEIEAIRNIEKVLEKALGEKQFSDESRFEVSNADENKNFKRWFGESKVVNDDGSPKIMYRGGGEEINVFDRKKSKPSNLYGRGFYFTDSEEHAKQYGDVRSYYLSIQNPLNAESGEKKITPKQMRTFLEAVAEDEDYGLDNYGFGATVDSVLKALKGRNDFDALQDINATAVGDFVAAIELFNEVNGTKYDGIITPTETVVFDSKQIKSATNNVGTFDASNPDIRYSLPSDDILDEEIENYRAGIDTNWQDKQKESQFAKETGQNTNVLSPEAKKKLLDDPFYTTTSEKKNLALAVDKIAKDGYQRRRDMMLQGDTNLLTPEGQTEAYVLCKMAKESGDSDAEASLAFMVKESGTQLAQSLAMRNIYNRMSPDAQLKYVQKAVNKINAAYEASGKDTRVAVPAWLPKAIEEANGDAKLINQHLDDAYREIAKSMPYSFKDWESTWRYLAMLGNPMTHAKNVLGTALYYPYIATRDKMSAVLQMFKPVEARTRAFAPAKKEYKEFAKIVAKTKKDALNGNSMSATSNNALAKIEEYRQKGPDWMDAASDFNSRRLAKEDLFWKNIFFKKSLASYLQAHNADLNNLSPELLNAAVQHALNDAYKNTFNNTNQFAQWLSKMEKESARMGRAGRIGAQAINTILPFKNTPANVLARGIDFSPVGLVKALTVDAKKLKDGKITSSEYFDRLTMGITGGVGAVGLGFLLASLGALHIEENEMEDKQKNSVDILGQNIAIDWAGTAAMPILMGGKLYDAWQSTGKEMFGDGFDLSDIPDLMLMFGDAMRGITDPMINLSVLQGVKNLVQTAGYAGDDMFSKLGTRVATTYASQFVPSFFGAIARIIDDTRRTTYTDKNIKGLNDVQYFVQSVQNKLPFLSKNGMPYIDSWGNEESNGSFWRRLLNNLLLPGYSKSIESPDEVEKMLSDLYDTAVAKDFPEPGNVKLKAGSKSFSVNGKEYHMSADEYVKYSKTRGQTAYNLLHELMQTEDFYNGSDYYKYKSVENIWAYANATAKKAINSDYTSGTKWINTTANPLESAMEQAATANKNHVNDELKEDLYSAIVEGNEEDIFSITQMLLDNGVTKKSLKTSISNNMQQRYKNLYKEDSDDLLELETSLMMTGVITMGDINGWLIEE